MKYNIKFLVSLLVVMFIVFIIYSLNLYRSNVGDICNKFDVLENIKEPEKI